MARSKKLYCYVDESGQDTKGALFVVAVAMFGSERQPAVKLLERIEKDSGKGPLKWTKTAYGRRIAYIRRVLNAPLFKGKLTFAHYQGTQEYLALTTQTVATAVQSLSLHPDRVTVFFDGLPRSQEKRVGSTLRRLGLPVRKVRGVRKDENNALIRLADALCGLLRGALKGQPVMRELVEVGLKQGFIKQLAG